MPATMERERPQRPRLSQIASSSSYSQTYTAPKRTPHDSNPHAHTHARPMQAWRYPLRTLGNENNAGQGDSTSGRMVSLDSPALEESLAKADAYTPRQMPVSGAVSIYADQENSGAARLADKQSGRNRSAQNDNPTKPVQPVPTRRVTSPLPSSTPFVTQATHSTPPSTRYKTHRFAIDVEAQHSSDYANPDAWMSTPRSSLTMSRPASPTSPTFGAGWGTESTPGSPMLNTPSTPAMHRVVLGGIVSSPMVIDANGWEEQELSIEVPGIVLTEPHNPTRIPSPPPKHILLLPPTSLTLPMHNGFEKEKSPPPSPLFGSAFPSRPASPSSISTCGLFARRPSLMSLTSALRGRGVHGDEDSIIPFASTSDADPGTGAGTGGRMSMVNMANISRTPSRVTSPAFAGLALSQPTSLTSNTSKSQRWTPSGNTIRMLVLAIIALLAVGHFYMDTLLDLGDRIDAAITITATGAGNTVGVDERLAGALR